MDEKVLVQYVNTGQYIQLELAATRNATNTTKPFQIN